MNIIPQAYPLIDSTYQNGNEARYCHPRDLDAVQLYLTAGFPWFSGTNHAPFDVRLIEEEVSAVADSVIKIPLLVRPWTEFVDVSLRALGCNTAPGGGAADHIIDLALKNNAGDVQHLGSGITFTDELPNQPYTSVAVCSDGTAWSPYSWLGSTWAQPGTPDAGEGSLKLQPQNAWRFLWLVITITGFVSIAGVRIATYPSADALS